MKSFITPITESNCNARLTYLYNVRDNIGQEIDKSIVSSDTMVENMLNTQYQEVCDTIDELIAFRRTHDCLLEGDDGYGFI